MQCSATQTPVDIDLPALRKKYRVERDKRIRADGQQQYVEVADDLADFYEVDPHAPPVPRDPISDDIDVAVLGGGFAGLIAAARLKEAGVSNVRVIEMGGDFGGTWYWNNYPGAQCDVDAYSYLPLLEEVGYIPKERYSYQPEIYGYCRQIGKHFGLYEQVLFSTIVRALRWDDSVKRWRISTNRGDDIRARFVIMANGVLNKPKLPGIPGLKTFKGRTFHTCRWDYDYTGGNTHGGLVKLAGKRVAIIGTGATAIQVVPHLGRDAKHLYVFQRTPSSVDARGNRPTDPEWAKTLKPGWQAARLRNFYNGVFERMNSPEGDLICDGFTELNRNIVARLREMGNPELTPEQMADLREVEDYRVMARVRQRVDDIVKDKKTAEGLKAWYRFNCKRPCFNDDYLPTFNRSNVTLVDVSSSKGVERITEKGLVANGVEYEVECIIYASGFEVTHDLKRRYGIEAIEGRDGLSLYDHWAEGYRTYHGMMSHGFPNIFFTGYTQSAISAPHNLMYEQQCGHMAYIIKETMARGAKVAEPTQAAQDAWVDAIRDKSLNTAQNNAQFLDECPPSYFNSEGTSSARSPLFGEPYGAGYYAFDQLLKEWREKGDLEGLVLR
jgi:cation diffusion facilitator CzcD-associated flavoprotein CzcO